MNLNELAKHCYDNAVRRGKVTESTTKRDFMLSLLGEHSDFQNELNNEAKGKNIKPRIYEKMQFVENKSFKTKAKKCIN